jgi:hypothetical protein
MIFEHILKLRVCANNVCAFAGECILNIYETVYFLKETM